MLVSVYESMVLSPSETAERFRGYHQPDPANPGARRARRSPHRNPGRPTFELTSAFGSHTHMCRIHDDLYRPCGAARTLGVGRSGTPSPLGRVRNPKRREAVKAPSPHHAQDVPHEREPRPIHVWPLLTIYTHGVGRVSITPH